MPDTGMHEAKFANLPSRAMGILCLIRLRGGMLCTGSCHHQKKEQLHCRQIGRDLNMGFSAVWERVGYLLKEGLIVREKTPAGPVKFTVTLEGEKVLDTESKLRGLATNLPDCT